jgi:hypothetical protein
MTCGAATSRFAASATPPGTPSSEIVEHSQCRPAVSWFQSQKQRARILDVSHGTTLGGRLQGNRSRMIWTADEIRNTRSAIGRLKLSAGLLGAPSSLPPKSPGFVSQPLDKISKQGQALPIGCAGKSRRKYRPGRKKRSPFSGLQEAIGLWTDVFGL